MDDQARYRNAQAQLQSAEAYPLLQPHKPAAVLLRMWEHPAFHAWTSWTLIRANGDLLLRRLIWHRRATPAAPDDLMMAGADVEARDGTGYGLEWSRLGGSARIEWWPEAPAGWEALAQWHGQAAEEFQRHLPVNVGP